MGRHKEPYSKLFKRGQYYTFWYYDGKRRCMKSTGKTALSEAEREQLISDN